jgi:hypothetical protein
MAGDFVSVTMDEARARIRDIAGDDISNDEFNSFRALANHRNKIIHFFHSDMERGGRAKEIIVAEHCRAWFHLHRLLNRWGAYLDGFGAELSRADRAMKAHRKYLKAKFMAIKADLDLHRAAGQRPKACSACGFKASIPEYVSNHIADLQCLVCDHSETQVEIDCPHCGNSLAIANEGYARCGNCGGDIEPSHIVDALTDKGAAHVAAKEGDDGYQSANCANCEGYHTVVRLADNYFCANCFELFHSVSHCGWCNERSTGDMEDSFAFGCTVCDGRIGWAKDD